MSKCKCTQHSSTDQYDWFSSRDTLAEARAQVVANLDDGSHCPCCGRLARRYKRTLYCSQVRQLIALFRLGRRTGFDGRYFHRTEVAPYANNNDLVFLRHWGLLEQEPNADPTKKDSGNVRITELGCQFVLGKVSVPKGLYQYNDAVERFTEETTTCREALGQKFNYDDLMSGEQPSSNLLN